MSKSRGWPLGLADSDVTRLRSYIVQTSACWIWMGALSTDGYGRFGFTDTQTGERRTVTPHRAAAELVLGPAPEGSTHLHDCDVRLCCRVGSGHVRIGTQAENRRHAVERAKRSGNAARIAGRGAVATSKAVQAAVRAAQNGSPADLSAAIAAVLPDESFQLITAAEPTLF